MLERYIQAVMGGARYKQLEDGTWFAEIPGFQGVWANGSTVETCRQELIEVLEEWIFLKARDKDLLPVVSGVDINIKEVTAV